MGILIERVKNIGRDLALYLMRNIRAYLKLIILFLPVCGFAQAGEEKSQFRTQGEVEDYWAKELFEKFYYSHEIPIFKGKIVVKNDNYFAYDGQVLMVSTYPRELKNIFSKGIFYPQIITGDCAGKKSGGVNIILNNCDTLRISNIEELTFLKTPITKKRFRFLVWRKGLANPQLQFIELTNDKAKENMTLSEFVKGARLTFYREGAILI